MSDRQYTEDELKNYTDKLIEGIWGFYANYTDIPFIALRNFCDYFIFSFPPSKEARANSEPETPQSDQ